MSGGRRVLVAAFGDAGHAFPAIALARGLAGRGHEVMVETWERWREPVEAQGLGFRAAEEYTVFPPPPAGGGAGPADAARALQPLFDELRPELVVSDILTLAPALAAEVNGCPRATLVPHLYPVHAPGLPFFGFGAAPPRTPFGRWAWRAALPVLEGGLRRGREQLNGVRATLGLAPLAHFHGGISAQLALVATLPGLEYPRPWPASVEVCGPLTFELPHPDVPVPGGEEPLVLVAPSTAHDPDCTLVRTCFAAFAGEPVRVLATTNGQQPAVPIEVPANGALVEWLSYSQVMPAADLVVCHGGHGTLCRALGAGKPVLVSSAIGDMAENGARAQWAGTGLYLPAALRTPRTLRLCAEEILADPLYAARAARLGAEVPPPEAEQRACRAVEKLLS